MIKTNWFCSSVLIACPPALINMYWAPMLVISFFRGVLLWRVIRPLCGIDWERGTRVDRAGAGTACCFPMLGEFFKKEGEAESQTRREAGTVNQPHLGFLYRTDSDTCHPPIAPSIWHISKEQIVNHKEMKLITTSPASDWKQPLMMREITARRAAPSSSSSSPFLSPRNLQRSCSRSELIFPLIGRTDPAISHILQ